MSQTDQHSVRVSDGRDTRKDRLEFNKLRKRLRRQTGKAIADFNMIEAGDRIMVCISGGKDSHAMLELLISLRSRRSLHFLSHSQISVQYDNACRRHREAHICL